MKNIKFLDNIFSYQMFYCTSSYFHLINPVMSSYFAAHQFLPFLGFVQAVPPATLVVKYTPFWQWLPILCTVEGLSITTSPSCRCLLPYSSQMLEQFNCRFLEMVRLLTLHQSSPDGELSVKEVLLPLSCKWWGFLSSVRRIVVLPIPPVLQAGCSALDFWGLVVRTLARETLEVQWLSMGYSMGLFHGGEVARELMLLVYTRTFLFLEHG